MDQSKSEGSPLVTFPTVKYYSKFEQQHLVLAENANSQTPP